MRDVEVELFLNYLANDRNLSEKANALVFLFRHFIRKPLAGNLTVNKSNYC
ncbi:hypothetical protein [Enterovibrio norvegicus]|uniref:hypothetical protein n=1 Tax=Enterovibrio norvegicus TaxID=188144 RepID=UPI003D16144D